MAATTQLLDPAATIPILSILATTAVSTAATTMALLKMEATTEKEMAVASTAATEVAPRAGLVEPMEASVWHRVV